MKNRPCSSDTACTPAGSNTISAPCRTAPSGSVTFPKISPLSVCADVDTPRNHDARIATAARPLIFRNRKLISESFFGCERAIELQEFRAHFAHHAQLGGYPALIEC